MKPDCWFCENEPFKKSLPPGSLTGKNGVSRKSSRPEVQCAMYNDCRYYTIFSWWNLVQITYTTTAAQAAVMEVCDAKDITAAQAVPPRPTVNYLHFWSVPKLSTGIFYF